MDSDDDDACAWTFFGRALDSSSETQHWSIAGTHYERQPPSEALSPSNIGSYFPDIIHEAGPIELTDETCTSLVLHDPVAAFRLWWDLYHVHVPCAIDVSLWAWTKAVALQWQNVTETSLTGLLEAGLISFYGEIVCREDFFDDCPVSAPIL